jgi:hypothetical protein
VVSRFLSYHFKEQITLSRHVYLEFDSSSRVQGGIAVVGMFYIPQTVLQATCDKPVRRLPYSNCK